VVSNEPPLIRDSTVRLRHAEVEGRRTVTGEVTPEYLTHPLAPRRMAEVIPQARLIAALLRNPVDRAYSDYHRQARKERETRTFEEAMGHASLDGAHSGFLSRSVYVDHLLRWSEFFSEEQMLVLKSEDFFVHPVDTLRVVLNFLDLPEWEPKVWGSGINATKASTSRS
jgi:hypothetical protein